MVGANIVLLLKTISTRLFPVTINRLIHFISGSNQNNEARLIL